MFSREIADKILARLSAGESLNKTGHLQGMRACRPSRPMRLWAVDESRIRCAIRACARSRTGQHRRQDHRDRQHAGGRHWETDKIDRRARRTPR